MKIKRSISGIDDSTYELALSFVLSKKDESFLSINVLKLKDQDQDQHHIQFIVKEDDSFWNNLLALNGFQEVRNHDGLTTYNQPDSAAGLKFIEKMAILDTKNFTCAKEFVNDLPFYMDLAKLQLMNHDQDPSQEDILQQVIKNDVSWLFKLQKSYTDSHQFDPTDHPSKYAFPTQFADPAYKSLVKEFDRYMQSIAVREARSDTEYLLEWLDNYCTESWVQNYDNFLRLAQAVAERGYKTAIDVPLSEEEFHYRKYIKEFDAWMQRHTHTDKTHLEDLLVWLDKESDADDVTYQQFLVLARVMAKKGYLTMIDVPISEMEFNDFFLKKYREMAKELVSEAEKNLSRHITFARKFDQMTNAVDADISPYKQSRILADVLRLQAESIRDEYRFMPSSIFGNRFFPRRSWLYEQINSQLGDSSLPYTESEKKYLLEKFHQFLNDHSVKVLEMFKNLKSEQSNEKRSAPRM